MATAKKPAAVKKAPAVKAPAAAASVEKPLDTSSPAEGLSANTGAGLLAPGADGEVLGSENQNLPPAIVDGAGSESDGQAEASGAINTGNPAAVQPAGTLPPAGGATDEGEAPECDRVMVTSKVDGFRRGGRAWSCEATTVNLDEFTEEQLEALCNEPMLDVAFIEKGVL